VTILDEDIPEDQYQLLRDWRLPVRRIGVYVGRLGMKDRDILSLLHSLPCRPAEKWSALLSSPRRHPAYPEIILIVSGGSLAAAACFSLCLPFSNGSGNACECFERPVAGRKRNSPVAAAATGPTLEGWSGGERNPTLEVMADLACALGVDMWQLLEEDDVPRHRA